MIRILFLTAAPVDKQQLKLYKEFESIDDKIQQSKYRSQFNIIPRFSTSISRLHEYIIRFNPAIVHFSGHGTDAGELVFQDNYGISEVALRDTIRSVFGILNAGIRCVILNSCYSVKQANIIREYVDCIIGISGEIYDLVAIEFATNFYFGLASGKNVEHSYKLGATLARQLHIRDEYQKPIDMTKQTKMFKLIARQNVDPSQLSVRRGKFVYGQF